MTQQAENNPITFTDPFGLCPEDKGGDGKTKTSKDCPEGSVGLQEYRSGEIKPTAWDPLGFLIGIFTGGGATAAESAVEVASGDAIETGVALVARRSTHQVVDNLARGVTPAMEDKAIELGVKYLDMKHPGTIAHVLEGAMASGKTLFVATDVTATKVVTSMIRRSFNPETLFNGAPRWLLHP